MIVLVIIVNTAMGAAQEIMGGHVIAVLPRLTAPEARVLRDLLHTQPLTRADLAVVFALDTLGYAAVRLDRLLHPPRRAPTADMPGPARAACRSERSPAWPR